MKTNYRFQVKQQVPSVRLRILIYMAFRNLMSKKLRSSLTLFGVIIGTGSVFLLLSFGIGLQHLVQSQFIGSSSIKAIDISTPNSRVLKFDQKNIQRFAGISHVSEVGRSYSLTGKINLHSSDIGSVIFASDETFQNLSNLKLIEGRFTAANSSNEIVVNTSLLDAVGISKYKESIGQKTTLEVTLPNKEELDLNPTIVGVVQTGSGSEILLPSSLIDKTGADQYSQVKLVADAKENIPTIRSTVESMGFSTQSPIDTLSQINQVFYFFNFVLLAFGGIGLIIAILGMMNTLTVSLLERTREIGLLISLGARQIDMKRMFQAEALVLSVAGGILGIITAILLGVIIDLMLNALAHGRGVTDSFSIFAYPWWLIVATLLFISIIGMVVVYLPARRAAHTNPIDALRYE